MRSKDRVELLEAKLELTRHLAPEERAELSTVTLPAIELATGPLELEALFLTHNAFAAGVVDGMVVQAMQIGEQSGVQLLGPGDLLLQPGAASPPWLERSNSGHQVRCASRSSATASSGWRVARPDSCRRSTSASPIRCNE